jgi:hypothetical protein
VVRRLVVRRLVVRRLVVRRLVVRRLVVRRLVVSRLVVRRLVVRRLVVRRLVVRRLVVRRLVVRRLVRLPPMARRESSRVRSEPVVRSVAVTVSKRVRQGSVATGRSSGASRISPMRETRPIWRSNTCGMR